MSTRVVPFQVDAEAAAQRFRGMMTRGVFRPRDLASAGTWETAKPLYLPVRRVRVTMSTNWSALSGTKQRNGQLTWSPVTGQHHGVHEGIVVLGAPGPWFRALPRLTASLPHAVEADPSAEVVRATVSEEDTKKDALKTAKRLEEQACLRMVPGPGRKGIKVSSTIESLEVEDVLVPVYEVAVSHHGTRHVGFVDGHSGALFARPPTSGGRVGALIAGVVGVLALLVAGFLGISTLSAAQLAAGAAALAEHHAREEEARVAQVQTEWSAQRERLSADLLAVEPMLAARDAAASRAALSAATPALARFDSDLDDAELDGLVKQAAALDGAVTHLEAVSRGLAAANVVVGDKSQCTTPKAIADAWADLRQTRPTDPEYGKATALTGRLEKCRSAAEKELSAGLKQIMIGQREAMAEKLGRGFLDNGFDVRVSLRGVSKNEMRLDFILMSKVLVHQITDGGSMSEGAFLRNLQNAGVRRVVFSDTWNESWSYDLEPEDEDHGGRAVLAGMGLGEKLVLEK
ncbi:MAG: hypothetical protein ABMA64_04050 [Myxococcota bacterium]